MRFAIDARKLHDFGIGTYVRNLLKQLARLPGSDEFVLICRPEDVDPLRRLGPQFTPVGSGARPYSLHEQLSLPGTLRRARVDAFHAPHYVLPVLSACRSVVTIHDCIHLMFPQYLSGRFAHAYARSFLWNAAHRSSRVITVSEASKRDILRFFRIPAEKISVIHNAIDERFLRVPSEEEITMVRERFQIAGDFLLYVGNIKPHKNVERLIDAFHQLRHEGFRDLTLVVIGDDISKYAALRHAVHRHKLHKVVRFLGYVPDQTLAVLYRLATVFVFPSLYEGFGLPPLEAMAMGTPVVTSNVSSLPEVVGQAAVLIDPYRADAIAEGIASVLADAGLRHRLRQEGPLRARAFSWERSVSQTLAIYREIAAERPGRHTQAA